MKIEFDLPEFKKELRVEIILRKDGEVIYSSSSPLPISADDKVRGIDNKVENKTNPGRKSTKSSITSENPDQKNGGQGLGGNMMDIEL